MVRFRTSSQHEAITAAVERTLADYGLTLVCADRRQDSNELWDNVRQLMEGSTYGIAVFEEVGGESTSRNVSLELGYMLALDRRCLLLKDKSVKMLPTDLAGHLCREFDVDRIDETLPEQMLAWLKDLGFVKRVNERLLVFLSQGGTCRDPMAKVIMQQLLAESPIDFSLRVEALALGPPSKSSASMAARHAIQDAYGADLLANHVPTQITAQLVS
jgi:hypothetical protein